jgi:glutaredoxin 3
MPDRVMYTKPGCPYCERARESLRADGIEFTERDATSRADWKEELMRYSRGSGLVPTIVVGDEVETVGWQGGG